MAPFCDNIITPQRKGRVKHSMLFIGSKLRKIRLGCDMSLDEAETITGVPKSTLADIEKNNTQPRRDTVEKICKGFQIMPEYFYLDSRLIGMGFEDDNNPGMLKLLDGDLMKFILNPDNKPYLEHARKMKEYELPIFLLKGLVDFWGDSGAYGAQVDTERAAPLDDKLEEDDPYYLMALKLKAMGVLPFSIITFWEHLAYLKKKHKEKKK